MYKYFLAIRYLNSRKIVFLSIAGIALGVTALIVVSAVMNGFGNELRERIRGTASHISVATAQGRFFERYPELIEVISGVEGVTACAPHIEQGCFIGRNSVPAFMIGIDPEREAAVGDFEDYLLDGKSPDFLLSGEQTEFPGVIMGTDFFWYQGHEPFMHAGENYVLMSFRMPMYLPVKQECTVVGRFETDMTEYDATTVYVQLETAQKLLGLLPDQAGRINVAVEDYARAGEIRDAIRARLKAWRGPLDDYPPFAHLDVRTWEAEKGNLLKAVAMERRMMVVLMFFITVVGAFSVMAILYLMVQEKVRDIGILKSLGATVPGISGMFLFQGFVCGLLGSLLGLLFGNLIVANLNAIANGIFLLTGWHPFPPDVYDLKQIPTEYNLVSMMIFSAEAWALAVLAAAYPAWKASRLDPVEALRFDGTTADRRARRVGAETEIPVPETKPEFFGGFGVHKSFRMGDEVIRVLRGVDIEVRPGEILAVVGPSGAGKSTLLHILGQLEAADAGHVFLHGNLLDTATAARRAELRNRTFGFVFQLYHLIPELTALENAMLPALVGTPVARWRGVRGEALARAKAMLERLGLGHRLSHRPNQLSGGERQRVAIARALLNGPELVFCDEPTGNLDQHTARQIQQVIWDLNAETGQSFVIVTHDEQLAARAHRTLHLSDGAVAESPPGAPPSQPPGNDA